MKAWRWALAVGLALGMHQTAVLPIPPAVAQTAPLRVEQLRVGVTVDAASVVFSASVPSHLIAGGKTLATIKPLDAWQVRQSGGRLVFVTPSGGTVGPVSGKVSLHPGPNGGQVPLFFSQDRWYRGSLEFVPGAGASVTAVNLVPMEEYLFGVVPGEMPASWEHEALKAQSIAARTYALHNLGKEAKKGYDVCRTTHCQVYDGAAVENIRSNEAVIATSGEVLTYNGRPIQAYFHASSGGYTDNVADLWQQDLPYIRAVADFDQASPRHIWHQTYSDTQVQAALAKIGVHVGTVHALTPVERTPVGRVKTMKAIGSRGEATFEAAKLRFAIGLYSTFFNVGRLNASQAGVAGTGEYFQFAGRGWGHGLGMSQWGARGLAAKGFNYQQILAHFYPGSQLESTFVTASNGTR